VRVIDPAPAIARQVRRVLEAHNLLNESPNAAVPRFVTSGDPAQFKEMLHLLLHRKYLVNGVAWRDGKVWEVT